MENASQALVIAGAILLAILIVALAMYIYNSAATTINDSVTNMSTQQIESFNNQFETYKGEQKGNQVSQLVKKLIANANTYKDEPGKVPSVICTQVTSAKTSGISDYVDGISDDMASYTEVDYDGNDSKLQLYVDALSAIGNHLEGKHKYTVTYGYESKTGLLSSVIISYTTTFE